MPFAWFNAERGGGANGTINRTQREGGGLMKAIARRLLGIPDTDNTSVRIPYGASSETGSAPAHNP